MIKATNCLFRGDAMKLLHLSALQHDAGYTLRLKKRAEYFCCYKLDISFTVNVYRPTRLPKKHKNEANIIFHELHNKGLINFTALYYRAGLHQYNKSDQNTLVNSCLFT